MKKIIYGILIILMMILIFSLSNQGSIQSTKVSDGLIEKTVGNVYKLLDKNVTNEKLSNIKKIFAYPMRKLAHVTLYLILGILIMLFLNEFGYLNNKKILLGFLICLLYSLSDEIHQLFVIGRSGEIKDVFLDSCSSFIGIRFVNVLLGFRQKNNKY